MRTLIITIILCIGSWAACQAQQTLVKGVVFEDTNHNSVFDANEPGIAGVCVSNGVDVVKSGPNGRYELPAGAHMIVFVIKPSGYRVAVDGLNIPRFYYIHKPQGSPKLKYPGSQPTGNLPASIDFPLVKYDEPEAFNVLVFGDTQPYTDTEVGYLQRGVVDKLINVSGITFGTTLGDITGDRPDLFHPVSEVVSNIGVPWYHVIGNHDHNYDTDTDQTASEAYESFFGPATYSFNYGKVHFIVIDDIIHSLNDLGKARYTGGLRDDQLQFVENDLRQVPSENLVVILTHIPFYDEGSETFRHTDRDRLFRSLSRFPNTLSMSGHTHYIKQYYFDNTEGWQGEKPHHHLNIGAICGDWWKGVIDQYELPGAMMRDGSPQGYFILRFNENRCQYDFVPVRYDSTQQLSIHVVGNNQLYANFFAGNRLSTLQYRVNGGDWQPMTMSKEADPLYTSIRNRWDTQKGLPGAIPSRPVPSEHLWKAPVGLKDKAIIEVVAHDEYGRTFSQKTTWYDVK